MANKFYKVDLHVHTPASSCYKGAKDDEEYFSILENAKKNSVDAIAVTDHNTISGYEKFRSIRNKLEIRLSTLDSLENKNEEINAGIKDAKSKLDLFSRVKIFLGVELTLNPGVHLIVIGEDNDIGYFNALLDRIGFSESSKGTDDCLPTSDVRNVLD